MIIDFDEIGYCSEIKLDIIRKYAGAYSRILSAQNNPSFHHIYIDAFAGSGVSLSKKTGEYIPGSPLNALNISPPFKEYHLIDLDKSKINTLRSITSGYPNVYIHEGDCNHLLISKIFKQALFEDYKRALCLLDPYGLQLNWNVIYTAGQMRSVDIFLNFPVEDINRSVLWHHPENVNQSCVDRMNAFWGDESWRSVAYDTSLNFFNYPVKQDNETISIAFRKRLQSVAGFAYVPEPIPMRNSRGSIVYYLYFASQKPVAEKIITNIFNKYRNRGCD